MKPFHINRRFAMASPVSALAAFLPRLSEAEAKEVVVESATPDWDDIRRQVVLKYMDDPVHRQRLARAAQAAIDNLPEDLSRESSLQILSIFEFIDNEAKARGVAMPSPFPENHARLRQILGLSNPSV